MPTAVQATVRNQLLARLNADDFGSLRPHLEFVTLEMNRILSRPQEPIEFVYFPEAGLASIVARPGPSTNAVEIGIVGREGLVGIDVVLETDRSPHLNFIQVAGSGWRVPSDVLRKRLYESRTLRSLLLRYVHAFITQLSSTAYANADFNLEERLARWLLMCSDRLEGDVVNMTHDFLALMLGVRRPGVTVATHVLEGEHMIKAQRGRITILDRDKLKATAGNSYGLAEAEYDRVMNVLLDPGKDNVVRLPTGTT